MELLSEMSDVTNRDEPAMEFEVMGEQGPIDAFRSAISVG